MWHLTDAFSSFARFWAREFGNARSFVLGCVVILVWVASGPLFQWSDTWQLVINTGTTIVTFLMVFLIQNTQTRDTLELNLKIDELIRSNKMAHNRMMRLERLTERQLQTLKVDFDKLADDEGRGVP